MKLFFSRAVLFAPSCMLLAGVARAQLPEQCTAANTITLQGQPKSMEPIAEPWRVRVEDGSKVSMCIVQMSPLDFCTVGGLTSTPSTTPNPIESVISTLSGLGAVSIGRGAEMALSIQKYDASKVLQPADKAPASPPPFETDPDVKRFVSTLADLRSREQTATEDQQHIASVLLADTRDLKNFMGADYRENNWKAFNPEASGDLAQIRNHVDPFKFPVQLNLARAKTEVDQLSALLIVLHKKYDAVEGTSGEHKQVVAAFEEVLAEASAAMATLTTNSTALTSAQAELKVSYLAAISIYNDFQRRLQQKVITVSTAANSSTQLVQVLLFAQDRKTSLTGNISCVSLADGKTPTTDPMRFSVTYRHIPSTTASLGFLVTTLGKYQVGTQQVSSPGSTGGVANLFAVTSSSAAQLFPMVFLNQRVGSAKRTQIVTHWWHRPEDELDITASLSAGFGVNPNSGTNQPEFFTGLALGLNRIVFHPGVHFGRTESLGGGFRLGDAVPSGLTTSPPLDWHYHPAFSIGFSVRTAPW